jgi:phosphatidylinositol alpha 1,6-mannosyltransferase
VAYFPDSFHEVNGVAHTSRQFEAFARRRDLPFLCVRAGDRPQPFFEEGQVSTLELPRGFLSFALDKDLRFDPAFMRHVPDIIKTLRAFRPDVLHITGPSEVGILGATLAHHLDIPLVASWHTNVHEYAARRSEWFLRLLPQGGAERTGKKIEELSLAAAARFYRLARILFAPNRELCGILEKATRRPCFLMQRGVDTELFSPVKRSRPAIDEEFVLGFVGRLSVEKNIALLATLRTQLLKQGITRIRFLIVGQGGEEAWLRENLPNAEFAGVLRGEELSRAYADMDLFVFPSHTDTFGNVVLEALASGVPAIVTPDGGPRYIVQEGCSGLIATDEQFSSAVASVMSDPARHAAMRVYAREQALGASWDAVFEGVYAAYETVLDLDEAGMSVAAL